MRRTISVTLTLPGWHTWPAATGQRAYLAHPHRHLFHITTTVEVFGDDREVEFHDLRDRVEGWWGRTDNQGNRGSCEAMALELLDHLDGLFSQRRDMEVSVGEDGEAWATVSNGP